MSDGWIPRPDFYTEMPLKRRSTREQCIRDGGYFAQIGRRKYLCVCFRIRGHGPHLIQALDDGSEKHRGWNGDPDSPTITHSRCSDPFGEIFFGGTKWYWHGKVEAGKVILLSAGRVIMPGGVHGWKAGDVE